MLLSRKIHSMNGTSSNKKSTVNKCGISVKETSLST